MKQLKDDVRLTLISRVPTMLLSFLSVVCLTRLLGPEGNGVYTFCMAVLNLFFTVCGFQLESVMPVFLAKHRDEKPKVFSATAFLGTLSFLVFVVLLAIIVFVIPGGDQYVIPPGQSVVFFFLFLLIAFLLRRINTLVLATLRGSFRFKAFNAFMLLQQGVPAVVYSTLLLISIRDTLQWPIQSYFQVILLMETLLAFTGLALLTRYRLVNFTKQSTSFIKPILSLSSKSLLSSSGHFLNKRLDVWFVQFFKGTSNLGQYGLATQIANFMSDAMTPFTQVLIPYVAGSAPEEHKLIVERTARLNLTIAAVASVGIAGTSWFFIPLLFGKAFSEAIPATQVLAIGVIFISQRLVFTGYFKAINSMYHAVRASWFGVVITIILDIALIPPYGILGAALATTLAYGTTSGYLVLMAQRKLGFAISDILLVRKSDIQWLISRKKDKNVDTAQPD